MTPPPLPSNAVRRFLESQGLTNQPVIVAVSGGADSVALLRLIVELRDALQLQVIAGHLDHGLREDSSADAKWVTNLARSLNIPSVVGRPAAEHPGTGLEAWARRERYAFLRDVALAHDSRWVAVAHTADDQAETVLHHIVRGTGLTGLAGMPAVRRLDQQTRLVRPCLEIRREKLREYLASIGQDIRDDPTNADPQWTRNEIRSELIPRLKDRYNPRVVESLLSLSRQAADAALVMRRQAAKLLKRAILEATSDRVRLQTDPFAKADPSVVREAAVLLWRRRNWPRQRMGFRHWASAADLLRGSGPAGVEWPDGMAGIRRGTLVAIERRR